MPQHCVALDVYHRPGSGRCTQQLREAMPEAEVTEPDGDGIIEVRVDAPDFEEALHVVWNGIASAKNTHTCAPRPDWEISNAAETSLARAALL